MSGKRWFCVPCPGSFKPAHQVLCPPLVHKTIHLMLMVMGPFVTSWLDINSSHISGEFEKKVQKRGFWAKRCSAMFFCSGLTFRAPATLKDPVHCAMLHIKWPAQRVMGDLALLWIQYCRRNQRLWCRLDRHIWLRPLLVYWPSSPPSQARCYVIYITYGRDSLLANHLRHH